MARWMFCPARVPCCIATCATPGTPALTGSGSSYSFQTQTFFNNGPGRCVTVTVTAATCTGTNFIGVNAYSPTVSAATRTGVTWVGDGGLSPNPSTTFSFNAPANAPIVFWIDRVQPVGTAGLVNCDYTIQSAELDAVPVVTVVTPIPTLSELALALLATLLAASAIYMTRGRMRR